MYLFLPLGGVCKLCLRQELNIIVSLTTPPLFLVTFNTLVMPFIFKKNKKMYFLLLLNDVICQQPYAAFVLFVFI